MLAQFLNQMTPRTKPQTRLFSAAFVWMFVGIFLIIKGICISYGEPLLTTIIAVISGLTLGLVKSRIVLDRMARKIIAHIGMRPSPSCLGGLFSMRNWALILIMAFFGKTFGALSVHAGFKTGLYVMVGSGLCYSSRLIWKAWRNSPEGVLQNP